MSASNPIPTARAWADVDLGALVANARTVLSVSGSRLLPMVKANAYGLGAVPVARALEAVDPWGFGVATVEEGVELRRAGIRRPIVVFSPISADAIEACLREDLRPVFGDLEGLRRWIAAGDRPFHVEIDTGMARAGVPLERCGRAERGGTTARTRHRDGKGCSPISTPQTSTTTPFSSSGSG